MGADEISLIIIIILGLAFLKSISSNSLHKKEIKELKEQDALSKQQDLDQGDDFQSDPIIVNGEKKYSPYSLDYIGRYKIRKIFLTDNRIQSKKHIIYCV